MCCSRGVDGIKHLTGYGRSLIRGLLRLQVTASTPAFAPLSQGIRRFVCDAERLLFCHVDSDPAVVDIIDTTFGVANVG